MALFAFFSTGECWYFCLVSCTAKILRDGDISTILMMLMAKYKPEGTVL